jgi:hypothetical protein
MFLLFLCVGIGLLIYGKRVAGMAKDSATWPGVKGKIVRSEVVRNDDDMGRGRDRSATFMPDVGYTYSVDKTEYEGSLIAFGTRNFYGSKDYANDYVERFPEGKRVSVFYDPSNPETAVLEPGLSKKSHIPTYVGIGLIALSLIFAVVFVILA